MVPVVLRAVLPRRWWWVMSAEHDALEFVDCTRSHPMFTPLAERVAACSHAEHRWVQMVFVGRYEPHAEWEPCPPRAASQPDASTANDVAEGRSEQSAQDRLSAAD